MESHRPRAMSGWVALLLTLLSFALTQGVIALAAAIHAARNPGPFSEALRSAGMDPINLGVGQLVAVILVVMLGLRLYRHGIPARVALVVYPVPLSALALALLAGAALQLPLAEIQNLLRELSPLPIEQQLALQHLVTPDSAPEALAIIFAIVVVAPAAEETLFRGLLLGTLADSYGPRRAVIISAALFGLSHVEPVVAACAALAGIILAMLVIRTGSLLPAIAVHLGVNALPLLLSERVLRIEGFNTVSERVYHLPAPLLLASGLVAAAALFGVIRLCDRSQR